MAYLSFIKKEECQFKSPVLFVGFPGIGQISKLIAGLLTEKKNSKKIFEIHSAVFPSSVLINEKDIVEKFHFDVYCIPIKHKEYDSIIVFTSNFVLSDDEAMNKITKELLQFFEKRMKIKLIISVAGIGLENPKEKPNIFVTSNDTDLLSTVKKKLNIKKQANSIVNQITGMNGLMLLSNKPSICFLVESFNHPLYVGLKESKIAAEAIKNAFKITIPTKKLEKEIKIIEKEVKKLKTNSENSSDKLKQSYIG